MSRKCLDWLLIVIVSLVGPCSRMCPAAEFRTDNFVVTAVDSQVAESVALTAERSRKCLAEFWLGRTFPKWSQRCPIKVTIEKSNSGFTQFSFINGEVVNWDMEVKGDAREILDSTVPHEVNHTIFATHFRRPLVRWADEGAASYVEGLTQRQRLFQMMNEINGTENFIPLEIMIDKMPYPQVRPMLSVYAEGHSLVSYLLEQKPPATFISLLELEPQIGWDAAFSKVYGINGVSATRECWLQWVAEGQKITPKARKDVVAFLSMHGCVPCVNFKRAYRNGELRDYEFTFVYIEPGTNGTYWYWADLNKNDKLDDGETEAGMKLAANAKQATKQEAHQVGVPLFLAAGGIKYIIGFTEAAKLLHLLGDFFKRLVGVIFHGEPAVEVGPPLTAGPASPMTDTTGPPSSFAEVDPNTQTETVAPSGPQVDVEWADVTVVVLIKKHDTLNIVSSLANGLLRRKLKEISDGKATIYIVSESTNPDQYKTITKAASVEPNPVYIVVLAQKQPLGLKALIAGKVERELMDKIDPKLSNAKVEVIIERVHSKTYAEIHTALMAAPLNTKEFNIREVIFALLGSAGGLSLGLAKNKLLSLVLPKKKPPTASVNESGTAPQPLTKLSLPT